MKISVILKFVMSLIVGVIIGFFLKDFFIKEKNFTEKQIKEIFMEKKYKKTLIELFKYEPKGHHEPKPVSIVETKQMIGHLYDSLSLKPEFLKETFSSSYVFNISNIISKTVFLGANPFKLQMRIYPGINPLSDSLTFIVAFESDGELIRKDEYQYEYIAPCPRNCPPDGKDYFYRREWEAKFKKVGRVFNCDYCDK